MRRYAGGCTLGKAGMKKLLEDKRISKATLSEFGVGYLDGQGGVHPFGYLEALSGAEAQGQERLVFPLSDLHGTRRGFAYRSKTLKSFYSEKVKPQEMLYGLDRAYKAIETDMCCFLVEGLFDALALHSAGIKNSVSSFGAHLSIAQSALLARFTKTVLVCYDPDDAGEIGARSACGLLSNAGVEAIQVRLPADPDDVLRDYGVGEFFNLCDKALTTRNAAAGMPLV